MKQYFNMSIKQKKHFSAKPLIFLWFFMVFANANATNYYVSSSLGNDLNDGKTVNTPWQTISKLKMVLNSLQPGDSVFFKCNDTFYGQLILSKSGNTTKNIYFGSYDSGKKPVISGTTAVSNWTETKTHIWEATCPEAGTKVTNFFINRIPQQIGRWPNATDPNKGYLSYESHSGTNQITDNELSDTINWTGAEAIVRNVPWNLQHMIIKSHKANTLLFTTDVYSEFLDGFGYFIQNDPRTLDQQGEWYYNPTNKKFSLYSETDPNKFSTEATQLDNIIQMNAVNYITIENLRFDGSGKLTIDISNCNNITIRNNEIDHSGDNAVGINGTNNALFESNMINHTGNNALAPSIWPYNCKDIVVRNNVIKNTALVAGMGLGTDIQNNAVILFGTNLLVEQNTIDSVGHMGIRFYGDTITIKNNVVSNYSMTQDDGGGIYTWSDGTQKNYSRTVIGNIVMNGIGAPEGKGWPTFDADGIYIDDRSANVDVIGNTIFRCSNYGIHIHNANHVNIIRNTVFDNGTQFRMGHDNVAPTFPITNLVVDDNLFVSKEAGQMVAVFETIDNGIAQMGTFDNNWYCRPLDDKQTFSIRYIDDTSTVYESLKLPEWQSKYNKDQHSGKSPVEVPNYTLLEIKSANFFYNSTFENNISPWNGWAKYNNGGIALAAGEGLTGNALKASFTAFSEKADGYMNVTSNSFSFTKGKTYRLRFAAKGNKSAASVRVIPRKNGDPWSDLANPINFGLNTSYNQYEFYLDAFLTEPNSKIDFVIWEGQGDVWFDNLELVEVDVERTNSDDYILFEYNAAKNDKTISIPSGFLDVKGKSVSGNVILKPFTSVVLFKNATTATGFQPEIRETEIQMFPNPANDFVTVKSNEPISLVRIYDVNGQLLKSFGNLGFSEYKITGLPAAGFYIVQLQTAGKTEIRKLVISN
jgi:parallel beta-helix repeat protein